jgi:MerR-like DNA binding protein
VEPSWTLQELVAQVATRIAALPAPRNGQVRAIPDDRTVRYYGTIGLLDRPSAMRGRTALYGPRHVAQVVAIKRLQALGRSLSEIQALWPTLDTLTLVRMSGVELEAAAKPPVRAAFWKREPKAGADAGPSGSNTPAAEAFAAGGAGAEADSAVSAAPMGMGYVYRAERDAGATGVVGAQAASPAPLPGGSPAIELRVELAPNVVLSVSVVDERVAISPADVRALRVAAAPLLAELASRQLASHSRGEEP